MLYNQFTTYEDAETIKCEYPVGIEYVTFYGRHRKGLFKISEQKLISDEYIESSYYESVFNNSEKSPLMLHVNQKSHLYQAAFLSYYSIMYYKDTGNIGINYTIKTLGLALKSDKVFTVKQDFYTLYIDKASGKPTMFLNKKLCYTNLKLNTAFQQLSILMKVPEKITTTLDLVKAAMEEYFIPKNISNESSYYLGDYNKLVGLYRVKRSYHLLKDLPWEQQELIGLYVNNQSLSCDKLSQQREKILVQLRKGNTKKATDLCFHGNSFPKSIKKLLLNFAPLSAQKETYDNIKYAIDKYDVNTVKSLYQVSPAYFNTLVRCLDLGFSTKHTVNVAKNNLGLIRDTIRLSSVLRNEELEFNSNISDYHDYLDNLYRLRNPQIRRYGVNYDSVYESVDTSEEFKKFETDTYIFRSPKTANELSEVGQSLNICVGSYRPQFFSKILDIVLITDKEDKYVGCIEVKDNLVVQAKLKFNRPVEGNKDIFNDTKAWMQSNNLTAHCNDLYPNLHFNYVEDCLPDMARAELLVEHAKEYEKTCVTKTTVRGTTARVVMLDDNVAFGEDPNCPF